MDVVFSLEHANFTYPDGQTGLENISFQIAQGERVAILGANASGKSTLLYILDALLYPTAGSAKAFGKELTEKSVEGSSFGKFFRQQVAFLFQNVDAQLFCPTVEDELAFGPRHLGFSEVETADRVNDMLNMFQLIKIRSRSPQTLSGGEKRRVGLAAVLTVGPSVLLLDEPTSGLDPRSRVFLVESLIELADAGKTLVVATHDLDLAHEVADRTLVLSEDHKLVADGPTDEILSDSDLLQNANLIYPPGRTRYSNRVFPQPSKNVR